MCLGSIFGSNDPKPQTITNRTINQIPAWMEEAGEETYQRGKPISERDYPLYTEPRLAGFSPETEQSFGMTTSATGAWQPAFNAAMQGIGEGMAPVGQQDIAQYMNPYTEQVISSTVEDLNRQYGRDKVQRGGQMAGRGSYMNEDRRAVIENMAQETRDRNIAATTAGLRSQAFNQALQQANQQRGMQFQGAGMLGQMAPQVSALSYGDAAAMSGVGAQKEGQTQQDLAMQYEDFLRQFYYPQEQVNWLQSVIGGSPYSSSQTQSGVQYFQQPNAFAQGLGALGAAMGGYGMMGGTASSLNPFSGQ